MTVDFLAGCVVGAMVATGTIFLWCGCMVGSAGGEPAETEGDVPRVPRNFNQGRN